MEEDFAAAAEGDILRGVINSLYSIIDNLSGDLGSDVYERMESTDAEVCKCVNVLKMAVTGDGYDIAPAVALQTHPEFKQAVAISDFLKRAVDRMNVPLSVVIEEYLDAIIYGHKIGMIRWEYQEDGPDKGKFHLHSIKLKPLGSVGIVLDPYANLLGYVPTYPDTPSTPREIADALLHPEKCAMLTLRRRDENPLGRSFLRAAHIAWKGKQNIWPELHRYLMQCAIPGLVFIAPPSSPVPQYEYKIGEAGKPEIIKDSVTGRPKVRSRVQAILQQGIKFRNSSVMAIEHGGDVKQVEVKGEGGAFKVAREMYNEEIEMSILFQILATSQGKFQARAAAETHLSVFDLVIAYLRTQIVLMLVNQVFRPLVRRCFGPQFLHLVPKFTMGDTERRSFPDDAKAVAALCISKFLHPSQYPLLDLMLGIPQRDPEQWSEFIRRQEELEQSLIAQPAGAQPKKGTSTASPNTNPDRVKKPGEARAESWAGLLPQLSEMTDPEQISGWRTLLNDILGIVEEREAALAAA